MPTSVPINGTVETCGPLIHDFRELCKSIGRAGFMFRFHDLSLFWTPTSKLCLSEGARS